MNLVELNKVAKAMVAPGKGILAADESSGTIKKRCALARPLRLRLEQQGAPVVETLAHAVSELVCERPWLNQLDEVIVGLGIPLLRWRSGGSNTPTI